MEKNPMILLVSTAAFDNNKFIVHKLRLQMEVGRWSKKSTFCKPLYHRECKRRWVGGQKKSNFVNVVCERPLMRKYREFL